MRSRALWRLDVVVTPEAEDAVQECLSTSLGQPASTYFDAKTGRVTVSVFFVRRSRLSAGKHAEIMAGLKRIRACGLLRGPDTLLLERIRRQDWAESWKRHFRPIEIGRELLVKPSWSRRRPKRGQGVIVLDPGLSFGTGHHPTTRFCLEQLVAAAKPDSRQSFLDIGTGSGILAIAAARLGFTRIVAFDQDPESVRVAGANARQNSVQRRICLRRMDVRHLPNDKQARSDVVCANLVADLLIQQRRRISRTVADAGVLILAGILRGEFAKVRRAYTALSFRLVAHRCEGEWESGAFARNRAARRRV